MNNLYLCGAEDKETLVVIDGWACREDRNFVELISAPSRGSVRKIVSDTIWCGEFTKSAPKAPRFIYGDVGRKDYRDHNAALNVLKRAGRVREPERSG